MEFALTEPRKGRISHRGKGYNPQRRRRPQKILKPPKLKNILKKVKKISEYESFEEWLRRLQGPMAPQMRRASRAWQLKHRVSGAFGPRQFLMLSAFIVATWGTFGGATSTGSLVVQEMRESGDLPPLSVSSDTDFRIGTPTVPHHPSGRSKKTTNAQKRRAIRANLKLRLKERLSSLSQQRERRIPVGLMDSITEGKWLNYMVGTLKDDNQYLKEEVSTVQNLLAQVQDLIDADSDGAGDGLIKKRYMAPILEPVIHDLAVQALKADWAFVNSSFHKTIYGDSSSGIVQLKRARKVTRALATSADIPYKAKVVDRIIGLVDTNPTHWYDQRAGALNGRSIVKFLRRTTKDYVKKSLTDISADQRPEVKESLHTAAIIDASLSGHSIRTRLSETSSVDGLQSGLNRKNPMAKEIAVHYRRFLKEQKGTNLPVNNGANALIVESYENPDAIVRDVKLLWSIFDKSAQNAFSMAEKHKYDTVAQQFLDKILRPFREKDAKNEGRKEGMDYLNDLLHSWANKVLVGIFVIVGLGSKIGCPSCRSGGTSSKRTPKGAKDSNDKILSRPVFKIGKSNKLWIEEKNKYTRISTRGHPDYYTKNRTGQVLKDKAKDVQRAGLINEHGHYEPKFNDDTNIY